MYSIRNFLLISLAPFVISLALAHTDVNKHREASLDSIGLCPLNSSVSVTVFRSAKGEWMSSYMAYYKISSKTIAVSFDLKKKVIECDDSKFLVLKGNLKDVDTSSEGSGDQPFLDEHMEKSKNESTDEWENISRRTDGYISKDDVFSMKKSLEVILEETKKALDEVKVIGHRMNEIEVTIEGNDGHISFKEDLMSVKEEIVNTFKMSKDECEEAYLDMRVLLEKVSQIEGSMVDEFNLLNSRLNHLKETLPIMGEGFVKGTFYFHPQFKGKNIALSQYLRTAERLNSKENEKHGGVISQRPLLDDEIFKIRIEKTVNKWDSYGNSIGLIPDGKTDIEESASISGKDGVWSIYSWGDSDHGYSNAVIGMSTQLSEYPLELRNLTVGTIIGVMRRSNGDVHFFFNGIDKGVAFRNVPRNTHAFFDVRYHVTKIRIVN